MIKANQQQQQQEEKNINTTELLEVFLFNTFDGITF